VTRATRLFIGLVVATLVASGVRATAEVALPDGPNRALVSRACGACHDLGLVLSAGGRNREGWNGTIEDMTSYGMDISPADRRLILEYLVTYLPPR
jgi:hypothetical protein